MYIDLSNDGSVDPGAVSDTKTKIYAQVTPENDGCKLGKKSLYNSLDILLYIRSQLVHTCSLTQ